MKIKSLILFIIFSLFLISCESKDKWINPYDLKADQAEVDKICKQNNKECGIFSVNYKGVSFEMDCGECSDGYECRDNTCWDINECNNPTLNNCPVHSDCHNLDMESDRQPYECICKENYSGDDCVPDSREKECGDLPANAEWNSVSSINQTWNGTEWLPSNSGTFNETPSTSECRFKCKENYDWTGSACKADSRTANCTGLPANAEWNTASSIEQTWNGEEWTPSSEGTFNPSKSSTECHFKCKNNFEWNGSECVDKTEINDEDSVEDEDDDLHDEDADSSVSDDDIDTTPITPCDPNPCSSIENSPGVCSISDSDYLCGCNSGYFWNGSECKKQITLGNICTGQNRCYNNTEEISCPTSSTADFYGQDTQYAKAGYCYPQSFTVKTISGKNIVLDNNTGLTWEQSPSEDTYTWDNRETHCNELNSSNYGGKSNWRVPNPLEFLTIADNSKYNPATNSNFTGMPTNNSIHFWTSKEYNDNSSYAYIFSPSYGWNWQDGIKTKNYKVLCVSGRELVPATSSDFTISSDGKSVTDNLTGLMWQKDYETDKSWQEALKFCEDSTYAGYSDWRLPNKNELASLINYEKSSSPCSYFPNMPIGNFWSSSTEINGYSYAWRVVFDYGRVSSTQKSENHHVRCVRSEKINDPCNPNPCNGLANSTQICTQHNAFEFSCGCNNGYFWNGQKCAVLPECSATSGTPCKDSTSQLIWSKKAENTMAWQDAKNYCDNDIEGGLTGWHLPNISELRTLVQNCAGTVTGGSCGVIDTGNSTTSCLVASCHNGACYDCASDSSKIYSKFEDSFIFWSSSTREDAIDRAWEISFTQGSVYGSDKNENFSIRCARCEDGYFWNGQKCAVLPECNATSGTPCKDSTSHLTWSKKSTDTMNWQTAIDYCNAYFEGGLGGWHLPNIDELRTIIKDRKTAAGGECNVSETNNCLSQNSCWTFETCAEACNGSWDSCTNYNDGRFSKFGETGWFWSSSTRSDASNNAWRVGFINGYIGDFYKSNSGNIRCVR